MALDLSASLLATDESSSATKQNAMIQAIETALNNLGSATYGAFTPGLIFDPAKIMQSGATSGQVLMWSGTAWVPTTAPSSVWTLITDTTLGGDATFSFTSIANSYKQLKLICYLRTDRASNEDNLGIRFNNDTGANYDGYSFKANGTGPTENGTENLAATSITQQTAVVGTSATANVFGHVEITIPNYADTTNNKTAHILAAKKVGTSTGNLAVHTGTGAWRSNAAISRVDLLPLVGTNFKTGSRVTLYGL